MSKNLNKWILMVQSWTLIEEVYLLAIDRYKCSNSNATWKRAVTRWNHSFVVETLFIIFKKHQHDIEYIASSPGLPRCSLRWDGGGGVQQSQAEQALLNWCWVSEQPIYFTARNDSGCLENRSSMCFSKISTSTTIPHYSICSCL